MNKLTLGAILLIVIGVVGSFFTFNLTDAFSFKTVAFLDEQSVNGKNIHNIEVNTASVDIDVEPYDGENIEVELKGEISEKLKDQFKLSVHENGDTVSIKLEKKDGFNFSVGVQIKKLILFVKIPNKEYESITINTASGDVLYDNLQTEELSINVASGDVKVENAKSKEVDLDSASGDLLLSSFEANLIKISTASGDIIAKDLLGEIKANSASGNIDVELDDITFNIHASSASGDIVIDTDEEPTSLTVDLKSNSGDTKSNLKEIQYEEKSEHRVIGEVGSGEVEVMIETASGDIELR